MLDPINGVDVASLQGNIDWAKVRQSSNIRFAIIRTTRGLEEVDTQASINHIGCFDNGILPGFYHRAFVDMGKPEQQALHFATRFSKITDRGDMMLAPVLDYEDQKPGQEFCQRFISAFRGFTGIQKMMIYTSGSYVNNYLGGESWMDDDIRLWIADYGRYTSATPGFPAYKSARTVIHQYSSTLKLASIGIPGNAAGDTDGDISTDNLHEIAIRR